MTMFGRERSAHWARSRILLPGGFGLAATVLLLVGFVSFRSGQRYVQASEAIKHSQQLSTALEATVSALVEAESNHRSYLLTKSPTYREDYRKAVAQTDQKVIRLRALLSKSAGQQQALAVLEDLIEQRIELLKRSLRLEEEQGHEAALQQISTGEGARVMAEITNLVAAMEVQEARLRDQRLLEAESTSEMAQKGLLLLIALSVLLIGAFHAVLRNDYHKLQQRESELVSARAALEEASLRQADYLEQLERRNRETEKLYQLGELLQSSVSLEEAYGVVVRCLTGLFPEDAGALLVPKASKDAVECVSFWGSPQLAEQIFAPGDCWALRRGRAHLYVPGGPSPPCPHVGATPGPALCLPLAAQNEPVGVLYLEFRSNRLDAADPMPLATAVGEQVSLALANLRLRETLRQQSIRDPLTGLFNRRYLEESLERETWRARRNKSTFAILMLDIDHFKRFNDLSGHEAGDVLLQEVGKLLDSLTRGEDIACRYGGEEFAIVLSGADAEAGSRRAEAFRKAVEGLHVRLAGAALGPVTVSIGVAAFPLHGDKPATLIVAADKALYSAKAGGRNRVMSAPPPTVHVES